MKFYIKYHKSHSKNPPACLWKMQTSLLVDGSSPGTVSVCFGLHSLGHLGRVLLGLAWLLPTEQSFNFRGDFSLVHGHAPLLIHFQLFSKSTDCSLSAGNQLFQILVPQLLPGPTFPRTLPAPLKFGFQIYLCWFTAPFPWLLHFASSHFALVHVRAGSKKSSGAEHASPQPPKDACLPPPLRFPL